MIRLRGGWEQGAPGGTSARRTLPLTGSHGLDGRVQLHRQFQRPTLDPARERLELSLADVPGLVAVRLNEHTLYRAEEGPAPARIAIPGLRPSGNRLTIEADLGPSNPAEWGNIALVVVGVGPEPA